MCLSVNERDLDAFLESITPEQMDGWEAHYLIRWEREAIVARHALAAFIQSKGEETTADDLEWLGRLWLRNED